MHIRSVAAEIAVTKVITVDQDDVGAGVAARHLNQRWSIKSDFRGQVFGA